MEIGDRDIVDAELEASPERFSPIRTANARLETVETPTSSLSPTTTLRSRKFHPLELDRIATLRSIHSSTVGGGRSLRAATQVQRVTTLGAGKIFAPADYNVEEFLVEFDGHDDPLHPQNWPLRKRIMITAILTYNVFVSSFASAIYSPGVRQIAERFHVSKEVAIIGLSLYVFGYASGPIVWGPMSELVGRRKPIVLGMLGFSLFTISAATCKDIQTLMLTRYFGGCFATSLLSVVPASFADMYNTRSRGLAITAFSMGVFVGPFAAPIVGGFIVDSHLRWRWTLYIAAIMGFLALALLVFCPETYPPAILVAKAGKLRRQTHDWRIHAKQEEVEIDFKELVTTNLTRPLRMLMTEPILLAVSLYMSFIYSLIYALLGAYPIVFQGVHRMNAGVGSLPFIGLIIGQLSGGTYIILTQRSWLKKLDANNGKAVPEWRLPPIIVGGVVFAVGLFWFAWTSWSRHIYWAAPTAAGVLIGFGVLSIFLQGFNYLIDAYAMFAASAIAANTVLRSLIAGVFPLFTDQMFKNLGIQWAGTLLACLATVMVPIPVLFYVFGATLRARSAYSPTQPKLTDIESPDESQEKDKEKDMDV